MCNDFCAELKRWLKAFTLFEIVLCVIQAVLLAILIGVLIFVILHFIVCLKHVEHGEISIDHNMILVGPTEPVPTDAPSDKVTARATFAPDLECTWKSSSQTNATAHYYLGDGKDVRPTTARPDTKWKITNASEDYDDQFLGVSQAVAADEEHHRYVLALVKWSPARVTFGCILTKISQYWVLTAASCVEAIEDEEPLENFYIVEGYGDRPPSLRRGVADVRVHPQYRGPGAEPGAEPERAHDAAALRCDGPLGPSPPPRLPAPLDYYLVAPGERLLILGYGPYRPTEAAKGRGLRQVWVQAAARAQCSGAGWVLRHLAPAGAGAAADGRAPLCAGARWQRAEPCHYCAGTPLLRAGLLLGLMSRNEQCAAACEPQLYVNLAALRDWIDAILAE